MMTTPEFIRVSAEEEETPIEVPLESDGTLLLTSLNAVFPKATGLKYLAPDSGCYRGVRLNDGRLSSPEDGWVHEYICVAPKTDKKRKVDDDETLSAKSPKVDSQKLTDLIVLNLAWKTDESTLRNYFSKYGELVMVQVKRHPGTGQSKGYGFIRFSSYESQAAVIGELHNIDGRSCEVRVPVSKLEGDKQEVSRKVHVGGISERITSDILRNYFTQFGKVVDVFMPSPFRAFAFVTFESGEVASKLLGTKQSIEDCQVNIGTAVPKAPPPQRHMPGMYPPMQYSQQDYYGGWYPPPPEEHGMHNFMPPHPPRNHPIPMGGGYHGMNMMPPHNHAYHQHPYSRPYPVGNNRM